MSRPSLPYRVTRVSKTVTVVDMEVTGVDWTQDFLLSADRHIDNPDSDRELQRLHLDEAVRRKAGVFDFGDFFCGMQGKFDRRSSKPKLRDEDKAPNYYDSIVANGIKFLAPYSGNVVLIGRGNHETGIMKNHETDVSTRLVDGLNLTTGSEIAAGGYSGFVRFQFRQGPVRRSMILYYHHGSGGGGPVTKGVIASNRRAAHVDADIYVSGHVHESWLLEIPRTRLTQKNRIEHTEGWHVQLPSYKEELKDGDAGYHVENGRPAKPIGAYWMRFFWRRWQDEGVQYVQPGVEFVKARN